MTSDELEDWRKQLVTAWMDAERFMKKAELISNEAYFPSIKELRYAARRYFQALEELSKLQPDRDIRTHFVEALENCRKAKHDAIDSSIAFVHGELDLIVRRAGLDVVGTLFPGFAELKIEMNKVAKIIVETRRDRQNMDGKYNQILEEHLDKIVELSEKLEISRPIIVASLKRRRRTFWLGTIVVGLALSLLFTGLRIYGERHGWFDFLGSVEQRSGVHPGS